MQDIGSADLYQSDEKYVSRPMAVETLITLMSAMTKNYSTFNINSHPFILAAIDIDMACCSQIMSDNATKVKYHSHYRVYELFRVLFAMWVYRKTR